MCFYRQKTIKRINKIISFTKNKKLEFLLQNNVDLFSNKELKKLLDFLESWDLRPIYELLDEKYKEYLWVIEEIKQIKIKAKTKSKLEEEKEEQKIETIELEQLLDF